MKYNIGKRQFTIEETINWLETMSKNDAVSLEDVKDLAKIIKKLYEDNKMIYESESEYKRD